MEGEKALSIDSRRDAAPVLPELITLAVEVWGAPNAPRVLPGGWIPAAAAAAAVCKAMPLFTTNCCPEG